jgi:peptidoglycan/xylan/chitin deacetylase (PgdA/CDA1 family)
VGLLNRLTKVLISLVFFGGMVILNFFYQAMGKKQKRLCSVLLYHSVAAHDRERFARQMDMLLSLATPVDIAKPNPEIIQGRQVAVTFDDGLQCFKKNALPELVKRRIPVALFIPSRCLGKRLSVYDDETVMNQKDLLNLPVDLVTIGSHSQTHTNLTMLDYDEARKEIGESKTDLETLFGREVSIFAFPYGEYNEQTLSLARQAGYLRTFSVLPTGKNNFLFGRIITCPKDWKIEFKLKLLGAYCWLPWAGALNRQVKKLFTF